MPEKSLRSKFHNNNDFRYVPPGTIREMDDDVGELPPKLHQFGVYIIDAEFVVYNNYADNTSSERS
jgi:hypothetical protein